MKAAEAKFVFQCTDAAKQLLLDEGIDLKYGARHLKRAIERFLVFPLSNLVATGQVALGDLIFVDLDSERRKLSFEKEEGGALLGSYAETYGEHFKVGRSGAAGATGSLD
jgi:ATP-dependent Clp protease ATP-binding subunit ClpA